MKFSHITQLVRQATVQIGVFNIQNDALGKLTGMRGQGSGFFISSDGWLLTSLHNISGNGFQFIPGSHKVVAALKTPTDQINMIEATYIAHAFPEIDTCAIKFNGLPTGAGFIKLAKTPPEQGDGLGIFGYPDSWLIYDAQNTLRPELLKPRVSKCVLARREIIDFLDVKGKQLLETQFNFVKGNSGGPIFSDETGEVVGLVMGYQHFPQNAADYAAILKNHDGMITGDVLYPPPAPMDLDKGLGWKRVTTISTVSYSYGIPCNEIFNYLSQYLPFLTES